MLNTEESQFVELVRTIARQEIEKYNLEYYYYGIVDSVSGSRFNIKNPADGSIYPSLLNQTGTSLSIGDVVKISAPGNKLGNAIIVSKNGATINT